MHARISLWALLNSADLRFRYAYALQPAVTRDCMHHSRYLVYAAALLRDQQPAACRWRLCSNIAGRLTAASVPHLIRAKPSCDVCT